MIRTKDYKDYAPTELIRNGINSRYAIGKSHSSASAQILSRDFIPIIHPYSFPNGKTKNFLQLLFYGYISPYGEMTSANIDQILSRRDSRSIAHIT